MSVKNQKKGDGRRVKVETRQSRNGGTIVSVKFKLPAGKLFAKK